MALSAPFDFASYAEALHRLDAPAWLDWMWSRGIKKREHPNPSEGTP